MGLSPGSENQKSSFPTVLWEQELGFLASFKGTAPIVRPLLVQFSNEVLSLCRPFFYSFTLALLSL